MDPYTIATVALGATFALSTGLWVRTSLSRRSSARKARQLTDSLAAANASIDSLRLGEREAAWAATTAGDRLRTALLDLSKARHEILRLRGDLTDIDSRLSIAQQEARSLAEQQSQATARVAQLEAEVRTTRARLLETEREHRDAVEGLAQRLAAVVKERDRLHAAARRAEAAEAELAALGRVHQELAEARAELDVLRARLAAPVEITTEEALDDLTDEIEDLRSQLAVRPDSLEVERLKAELAERRAGDAPERLDTAGPAGGAPYAAWERTLRSRVAQAVEESTRHLRAEVAHLRLVVAEKERMLRRGMAAPPAPPAGTLPVTVIKGIGPAIARILTERGISTVADVAALDDAAIEDLGSAMPVYPGRIRHDDWVGQARALAGL